MLMRISLKEIEKLDQFQSVKTRFKICEKYETRELVHQLNKSPRWLMTSQAFHLATSVFDCAVNHAVSPATSNLYNWTAALVFVRERIQRLMPSFSADVNGNQIQMLRCILLCEIDCIAMKDPQGDGKPSFFYNSILSFASHYAKHGIKEGMTPNEYWQKTLEVVTWGRIEPCRSCSAYVAGGWRVIVRVDAKDGSPMCVKTTHRILDD